MEKKKKIPVKKRLLPGDFQKLVKASNEEYDQLDNTEKMLEFPDGFFTFPEELKGEQDVGEKEFLVFYFDDKDDYQLVLSFFKKTVKNRVSHPVVDTYKLVELVKKEGRR
jgi:hypothetical protein